MLSGLSEFTLGAILATAWIVVFGVTLFRHRRDDLSRERLLLVLSSGLTWLAFATIQISGGVSGVAERSIQVLSFGLFAAGIALGARWLRQRTA